MITTKTLSTDKIIGADFNDANILRGKRRCEAVDDYRKSSLRKDALFGGFADEERAQIDDGPGSDNEEETPHSATRNKQKKKQELSLPRSLKFKFNKALLIELSPLVMSLDLSLFYEECRQENADC